MEEDIIPAIFIIDTGDNMDKLSLCLDIKSNSIFSNSKIIVTSNRHDKSKILDTGADLYLPKPYEITKLVKWVEHFMR